jgi:microcystin-dependent protein
MNPHRRFLTLAVLLAFGPVAVGQAQTVAGAPATIDYQGKALDSTGNPLANTTATNYEMQFRIYDAQEGGLIVWSEKQVVTVSKGMFSVRLGEGGANGTEGLVPQNSLPEAFNGKERFLGVTIVISGQTPVEILPRLAFLATPFAFVANRSLSAERLLLNASGTATPSSLNISQVSYALQSVTASTTLTDQNHTAIVDATSAAITVTMPAVTTRREYYILKRDASTNIVTVTAPSGGTVNGGVALKLKVKGDSVVLQNIGNNDWWVISDTCDKTPVGTVITAANNSATPPAGYLYCNGTNYSRTAALYADLYAVIGVAWGAPNASEFRVPDLRGAFVRGVDGGRGLDEDRNSRKALATGGNAGDAVGSYEGDALKSHAHTGSTSGTTNANGLHTHGVSADNSGGWNKGRVQGSDRGHDSYVTTTETGSHSHSFSASFTTAESGGTETRPENFGVYYFIKY